MVNLTQSHFATMVKLSTHFIKPHPQREAKKSREEKEEVQQETVFSRERKKVRKREHF